MAFQSIWYYTDIPEDIVDSIERDCSNFDYWFQDSTVGGDVLNRDKRNSQNAWIPTAHWVGGFMWHYIERANRENFLYDLTCIDGENLQYTRYTEGQYYGWHNDAGLATQFKPRNLGSRGWDDAVSDYLGKQSEQIRKLSVVMQLSDPDDYEGGNLQIMGEGGQTYFAPRKRGTVILFDSRAQHRVLKITKGIRKSIVGWVIGPRWK